MLIVVIPAKGGSSRLPNKNMAPLNGRPMLDYTIDDARACQRAGAIYVSTDSDAIAAHAETLGVQVIRRPESLGGDVPIVEVYRHALATIGRDDIKTIVGLQPDHPDRRVSVDDALDMFEKEGADRLFSEEAGGAKNGAHYIMTRRFLDTDISQKDMTIVDDCTNVHYAEDLQAAEEYLRNAADR
jgi:CMP-N-acetylneuraminic acid synthetase